MYLVYTLFPFDFSRFGGVVVASAMHLILLIGMIVLVIEVIVELFKFVFGLIGSLHKTFFRTHFKTHQSSPTRSGIFKIPSASWRIRGNDKRGVSKQIIVNSLNQEGIIHKQKKVADAKATADQGGIYGKKDQNQRNISR